MSEMTERVMKGGKNDRPNMYEKSLLIKSISSKSDLEIVVLGTACVEVALRYALMTSFAEHSNEDMNGLFDRGPLNNFAAKISIAHATGLISSALRSDLDIVRKIRNDFAHSVSDSNFEMNTIKHQCRNFRTPRNYLEQEKS